MDKEFSAKIADALRDPISVAIGIRYPVPTTAAKMARELGLSPEQEKRARWIAKLFRDHNEEALGELINIYKQQKEQQMDTIKIDNFQELNFQFKKMDEEVKRGKKKLLFDIICNKVQKIGEYLFSKNFNSYFMSTMSIPCIKRYWLIIKLNEGKIDFYAWKKNGSHGNAMAVTFFKNDHNVWDCNFSDIYHKDWSCQELTGLFRLLMEDCIFIRKEIK